MIYVGIDCGFSGAWAAIDHNAGWVGCGDMLNSDGFILADLVRDDIRCCIDRHDYEIIIEVVHSMPGQGVSSTFKFGQAFGQAVSMAQMMNVPTHFVTPQKWKKELGLTKDKELSLEMARALWPKAPLHLKKHNGRAEAALIAYYHLTTQT